MAVLTGTVSAAGYYKPPHAGARLNITIDVPVGAAPTAQVPAGTLIDHSAPRGVVNAVGRTATITVDDGSGEITAISIT